MSSTLQGGGLCCLLQFNTGLGGEGGRGNTGREVDLCASAKRVKGPSSRSVQFALLSDNSRGAVALLDHTQYLTLHRPVHELVYATKCSIHCHVLNACHGQTPCKHAGLLKMSETPALPARSLCSRATRVWKAVCLGERPSFDSGGLGFEHQLYQCTSHGTCSSEIPCQLNGDEPASFEISF